MNLTFRACKHTIRDWTEKKGQKHHATKLNLPEKCAMEDGPDLPDYCRQVVMFVLILRYDLGLVGAHAKPHAVFICSPKTTDFEILTSFSRS